MSLFHRCGFAFGSKEVVRIMNAMKAPYNLNKVMDSENETRIKVPSFVCGNPAHFEGRPVGFCTKQSRSFRFNPRQSPGGTSFSTVSCAFELADGSTNCVPRNESASGLL